MGSIVFINSIHSTNTIAEVRNHKLHFGNKKKCEPIIHKHTKKQVKEKESK